MCKTKAYIISEKLIWDLCGKFSGFRHDDQVVMGNWAIFFWSLGQEEAYLAPLIASVRCDHGLWSGHVRCYRYLGRWAVTAIRRHRSYINVVRCERGKFTYCHKLTILIRFNLLRLEYLRLSHAIRVNEFFECVVGYLYTIRTKGYWRFIFC